MNIQIGLACEPHWLCELISVGLAILLLVASVALIAAIIKENKKRK